MSSKTIKQKLSRREKRILDVAKQTLAGDGEGELEFDEFCAVSEGYENGAYVQAWIWVDFENHPELRKSVE